MLQCPARYDYIHRFTVVSLVTLNHNYTFRYKVVSQVYKSLTYFIFEEPQMLPKLPLFQSFKSLAMTQPNNIALAKPDYLVCSKWSTVVRNVQREIIWLKRNLRRGGLVGISLRLLKQIYSKIYAYGFPYWILIDRLIEHVDPCLGTDLELNDA